MDEPVTTKQLPAPPPKVQRPWLKHAKRIVGSALFGVALALACQALPPAWQITCRAVAKLIALLFGGS